MKQSTSTARICLPVLLAATTAVFADSWTCHKGDLTRQVLIVYPDKPALLPCEVFYSKPTENVVPRALWKADNSEGYCERNAAEFVVKLESWGWRCRIDPRHASSSGSDSVPAADPE